MISKMNMFNKYNEKSIKNYGRSLFTFENAIDFVEDCHNNNFSISQINCFVKKNNNLIEQKEINLNLYYPFSFISWKKEKLLKMNKSIDFINDTKNKRILFSFMLSSENEWRIQTKEIELINKFDGKKFEIGNEIVFSFDDSINFTEFCIDNDFAILGMDGFILENGHLKENLDYILDLSEELSYLSWEEDKEKSKKLTLKFLEWVNIKDIFFSFTIVSENEWIKSKKI